MPQPVLEDFSCFCIKDFFLFPRLSETSARLICLCAPLTFVLFIQTFLLKKLLRFVVLAISFVVERVRSVIVSEREVCLCLARKMV